MLFYSDGNPEKIVRGVGQFEDGELVVDNPEHIEKLKKKYEYDEGLTKGDLKAKSGGWYEFPDGSNARGDEVEEKLKRWNE